MILRLRDALRWDDPDLARCVDEDLRLPNVVVERFVGVDEGDKDRLKISKLNNENFIVRPQSLQ